MDSKHAVNGIDSDREFLKDPRMAPEISNQVRIFQAFGAAEFGK
jgi:hypothetical protein